MTESKNYMKKIKAVQDILRKDSLQKYYQSTILGMTILKRLCQTFEPKRVLIKKKYDEMVGKSKDESKVRKDELMALSGMGFYNVSGIAFEDLVHDEQKIYDNIKKLIESFSDNIDDIFKKEGLNLLDTCSILNKKKALSEIVKKFNKMDFSKEAMSNTDMGALFSELVVMVYGTPENGENWTPSDFVSLLTRLLLAEGCDFLKKGSNRVKLLDNAVGSGQLTSHFEKMVKDKKEYKGNNEVIVCGQDNSDLNIAVCKAEQIMLGQKPDNFKVGDTLKEDMFPREEFDFLIQNAPYGCGRKKEDEDNIKELLGNDLPSSSDNQMLFWKAGIRKLKKGGRAAYLSNGSPLFSGATLSGESKIRKWLFDNDYVEAIIKLTDQGFLDTGINVYAWIVKKGNKPKKREGIIQLIDASSFYHQLRKGIGNKRKEMTEEDIDKIIELYTSFPAENKYVKNFTKEDFYYREVTIQQPYQRNFKLSEDRINKIWNETTFNNLYNEDEYERLLDEPTSEDVVEKLKKLDEGKKKQQTIIKTLTKNIDKKKYKNREDFKDVIKVLFKDEKPNIINCIINALSEKDKMSDTYKDNKSKSGLEPDKDLNDKEYVPFKEDVDKYYKREVKPFIPDSWYLDDYDDKVGCEINFNKYYYKYEEPEKADEILKDIMMIVKQENAIIKDTF